MCIVVGVVCLFFGFCGYIVWFLVSYCYNLILVSIVLWFIVFYLWFLVD